MAGTGSLQLLVPRRSDGGWRDTLWGFCQPRWGHRVVLGGSPAGPFNRAAAINDAARKAGAWDVAVVVDADVVAEPAQVAAAARQARYTGRATLGFSEYRGLGRRTTLEVLAGAPPPWPGRKRGDHESSIIAVPRRLWDELGGYDERFCGWGQEDVAFAQAARVLGGGLERVPGVVYHLWHPPSEEKRRGLPRYEANQALGAEYRATEEPERMRDLVSGAGGTPAQEINRDDFAVLVPWRGGNRERERLWEFVRPRLEALGPVFCGDSSGPWSRAAACNDAARRARRWRVALIADADTIPDPEAIHRAVEQVGSGALRPHNHLYLLNPPQTKLALKNLSALRLTPRQREQKGGGLLVISRAAWDVVGGYDERFVGWGHEDSDMHTRLLARADFDRIEGKALHLWHARPAWDTPERERNRHLMREVQSRHRQTIEKASLERGYDVGAIL